MTAPAAGAAGTGADAATLPDLPFPAAPIEELLRLLVKAVRAHQLYLPNNPVYKGAVEAVRAAFAPVWTHTDAFTLTVAETELRWLGRAVLVEHSRSADSLPWTLHKDGLRELQFFQGFEQHELVRLFDILQRLRKAAPEEDDLLTMLWQADFALLRYRYVDLGAEPVAPLGEGGPPAQPSGAETVRERVQAAVADDRPALVNMKDFDATLYFLDERELEYLRHEIDREYQGELRRAVAASLLDIFEAQHDPNVRDEVVDDLEQLVLSLLATGELRTVAYILAEAPLAAERAANVTPAQRERLATIPDRLSAPDSLSQLLLALDEAVDMPHAPELTLLFAQLRPAALETIFAWLPKLRNPAVKPLVEAAADRLTQGHTAELVQLIASSDRVVAAEAIRRATALATPAAVAPLARVLADGDPGLRQAAVAALTAIGTPGALQALEKSIDDPDREVRVSAVRTLGARAHRGVFGRIEAAVKGRALKDADLTEKMAFFEAFGSMCGDGGVAYLDGILNGKSMFGRRADAGLRACAAIALGRVGTTRAQGVLQRAAGEKDVVVRNAVNRALRQAP